MPSKERPEKTLLCTNVHIVRRPYSKARLVCKVGTALTGLCDGKGVQNVSSPSLRGLTKISDGSYTVPDKLFLVTACSEEWSLRIP